MMSEPQTATIAAKLFHVDRKQELGSVEQSMYLIRSEEQIESKSLDDTIDEFVKKVQQACAEKGLKVQDVEGLCDQIAIGFVVNSKLSKEEPASITIQVPVCDAPKEDSLQ
jgi:hypothetical protein